MGPIDNETALVQVIAWRQTSAAQFPEAMLITINNAILLTEQKAYDTENGKSLHLKSLAHRLCVQQLIRVSN